MDRLKAINGVLSVVILLCLVVGWFKLLPPDLNDIVYHRIFYILIAVSFVIQSKFIANKNMVYAIYASAACCIIGACMPFDSQYSILKTIGLFSGVIISFFNRSKQA